MTQKNNTAYIILGLLTHKDSSGYDLKVLEHRLRSVVSHIENVGRRWFNYRQT